LAWGVALNNLVVPIAVHELDHRYAISTSLPFACLALGLVFISRSAPTARRTAAVAAELVAEPVSAGPSAQPDAQAG